MEPPEARAQAEGGAIRKAEAEEVERAFGFSATPEGLLADPELRNAFRSQEVFRFDWVHTFLGNGVVAQSTWALVRACCRHCLAAQGVSFS